jgi:aconitate hydratase
MLPFIVDDLAQRNIQPGDRLYIPGIRTLLQGSGESVEATLYQKDGASSLTLRLPAMTREERDIVLAGCLINYYAKDL